jgi:ribosomal protein S18 acetylase RimI-like enzyme
MSVDFYFIKLGLFNVHTFFLFHKKQPRTMSLMIEPANVSQEAQLLELYKEISKFPDGIILNPHEISQKYIAHFLRSSIQNGLILVGLLEGKIVGEIHAYTPDIYAFQHILSNLTIVVHPGHHGQGIGRKLFEQFLETVRTQYPHILRIELYVREHNERNVNFYKSLGFVNEGRQEHKIFVSKSEFETPLHMAWFNPKYVNS